MNQSGDNDFHVVAYVPPTKKAETIKNLKNFRKFHTKNTDRFFHYHFWVCDSVDLATQMGIDTREEAAGNVYMVRPKSVFNTNKPNAKLGGYNYTSSLIMTGEDILKDTAGSKSYAKILEYAFNSPIIVRDYMQFAVLS